LIIYRNFYGVGSAFTLLMKTEPKNSLKKVGQEVGLIVIRVVSYPADPLTG